MATTFHRQNEERFDSAVNQEIKHILIVQFIKESLSMAAIWGCDSWTEIFFLKAGNSND